MQIKDYITKNFPSLNWNILPQIFAENGVEMNEEIEAYLRNTPENTNWSILEQLDGSGSGEETWPKLIHIIYDNDWKMVDDSDFSGISEAFNFIQDNWNIGDSITSDYIILKVGSNIIDSYCRVWDTKVWWDENRMIYELSENSFYSYYDD